MSMVLIVHIIKLGENGRLFKNKRNILRLLNMMSDQARAEYWTWLGVSIDCTQFLLRQGLAFRGHDETNDSKNQGHFLELLRLLCNHNKDIEGVTLKNAPNNLKLITPDIKKYSVLHHNKDC